MPNNTIEQNKAYLEDSSRFPKLQSSPLLQPRYQHTHEEYNRIIEYLSQLYQKSQQAVYTVDLAFNGESFNPIANNAVATAVQDINTKISRFKVVFFHSIEASGSDRQQSSSAQSTSDEVFWFENTATFGFVPGGLIVVGGATQYYSNWENREEYTNAQFQPYADKIYYCVSEQKLYVWDGETIVAIGGSAGKSAYQIALDNGFVGTEQQWLLSLKGETGATGATGAKGDKGDKGDKGSHVLMNFEIDGTNGCLMLTEADEDESMDFEIDANGNFNIILN